MVKAQAHHNQMEDLVFSITFLTLASSRKGQIFCVQ